MSDERIPDGATVWIKDTKKESAEAFVQATVGGFKEGRGYTVVAADGTERTVRAVDCAHANPDGLTAPDNCYLIHISEATILANIRLRFASNAIYTFTGSILIAVNPFQQLPIYGQDKMVPYPNKALGLAEPHAYAMAEEAYRTFLKSSGSQSLVVSGESGSGKTETNKHLMQYIAWRSKSENVGNDLAQTILSVNPILEAFGNAKTSRNNNSSRFGKFVKIAIRERAPGVSKPGAVLGAITRQYLLEKSRVPGQSAGERNYHVFYQVVNGAPNKAELGVDKGPQVFHYLNQSGLYTAPGIDDVSAFKEVCGAFASIAYDSSKQMDVFKLIAGLLHLGNVCFTGDESADVDPKTTGALTKAAELLGMPKIKDCLVCRTLTTRGETTHVSRKPEEATRARDALTKAVYAKLFEYIVSTINTSIKGDATDDGKFIGLLDVYGFESFQVNTYEQLCINFANEKLQQFFLKFIFKAEEDLYRDENVAWTRIEYQDNQGCIDLIEKSPTGIKRLLDEACKKPNGTDVMFCDSVYQTHRRNDNYMEPRQVGNKSLRSNEGFVVRHFAGDVCYTGAGFLEKNNDILHSDFTEQMVEASLPLLATMWASSKGGKKGQSFNSVSRKFINDLNQLMDDLNQTKAHFIRCIKPTPTLQPSEFKPSLVLQQLRCSGTIDAVQLMAGAYPTRIPFQSIYERYAPHMPDFVQRLDPPLFCEALALALDIDFSHFQLGRSKIFFKAGKGQVLEELAERDLSEVIPVLLEKIKLWERRKAASALLQKNAMKFLCLTLYKKKRGAIKMMQHQRRTQLIYIEYRKKHLAWLAKREREEAERKRKEAEDRRRREEEEQQRLEAERKKQEAALAAAADSKSRQKAQEAMAQTEAAAAEALATSEVPTAEQIDAQVAAEMAAAAANMAHKLSTADMAHKDDMIFSVELERGSEGLGLDVDHYRKGATIGYVSPEGVAGKDGRIKVGDMIQGVNGTHCLSYDAVIQAIRNSGSTVVLELRRKHVECLLQNKMHMQVGATWEEFVFCLYSNRELTFEKTQPPVYNSNIDVRLAHEVRMVDAPNGGGYLEIETQTKTYSLRSSDQNMLHAWRRELYELLPYLHVTEVKCGWLYKKGETTSAGFKKRYCMLFSSYRLLYFDSEACNRRKGAVDLSVAEAVNPANASKGFGFEISTPGRTWVFAAEDQNEMVSWMNTLQMMLGDIRERKKRQAQLQGVTILKEGWADLKDETVEGEGAWEAHWFSLNSGGELKIYRDHEASDEELVVQTDLKDLERVERSKGVDFYDFCIDLIAPDKTTRMRPIDRGDMQAWLGVLQTQLSAFTVRTNHGSMITTLHQGWLEKKGESNAIGAGAGWKKRFFVLSSRQEQQGEELDVQFYLHYFKNEDQAADVSEGGVIDLGDVDEVVKGQSKEISIVTDSRVWQLRADAQSTQETWVKQLMAVCGEATDGSTEIMNKEEVPEAAADVTSIEVAELKMQVPSAEGQACWRTATFDLQSDGILKWKSEEAWPWDEGFIDIKKALGVWLLGPPGWRRLDIILPEHRWTLAAEEDETLQKWVKLLEAVAPEKPVSEIRNGWMEKKGNVSTSWKLRFFVLLSTHELLYFESDRSPKCKGVIDLKEATSCVRVDKPDQNYEFAFEVVSPKRTWVLCPDDLHAMQEWMADIKPLIANPGIPGNPANPEDEPGTRATGSSKRRKSVSKTSNRVYEHDEEGKMTSSFSDSASVLKRGWLEKRGALNTTFKTRYFVLTAADLVNEVPKMLRYFKDEESYRLLRTGGTIRIDDSIKVSRGSMLDPDHPYYFELATAERTYNLSAPKAEDLDEWIEMLGGESGGSDGGTRSTARRESDATLSSAAAGQLVEVHSGWMKKKGQGPSLFSKMQRRYFVLYDNRELHYFEGTMMDNITRKGRIRMAQATELMRLKPDDGKDFTFIIKVPGRDWILDPGSQAAWEDWESKLRPMLDG